MKHKYVIIIAGPTASGKTSLAIQLARQYNTEIISADSRQCFTEMNIGVAKPSAEQLQSVRHHFINSHSIQDDVNASVFENYALSVSAELFIKHDIILMAGGTGLYIKAFCEGLDDMPPISAAIRSQVVSLFNAQGLPGLQREVEEKDPDYFASGEILNPRRLMRALEVKLATGYSIRHFQRQSLPSRPFQVIKLGIAPSRDTLRKAIADRVDGMMRQGQLDEAAALRPFRELNALQTVGYAELFEYLEGNCSLEEAVERIKINTWQYARRQLTWFKKDQDLLWINGPDAQEAIFQVEKRIRI